MLRLMFARFSGHVLNIFNIKMLLFLGFRPSLTSHEVLEIGLNLCWCDEVKEGKIANIYFFWIF